MRENARGLASMLGHNRLQTALILGGAALVLCCLIAAIVLIARKLMHKGTAKSAVADAEAYTVHAKICNQRCACSPHVAYIWRAELNFTAVTSAAATVPPTKSVEAEFAMLCRYFGNRATAGIPIVHLGYKPVDGSDESLVVDVAVVDLGNERLSALCAQALVKSGLTALSKQQMAQIKSDDAGEWRHYNLPHNGQFNVVIKTNAGQIVSGTNEFASVNFAKGIAFLESNKKEIDTLLALPSVTVDVNAQRVHKQGIPTHAQNRKA